MKKSGKLGLKGGYLLDYVFPLWYSIDMEEKERSFSQNHQEIHMKNFTRIKEVLSTGEDATNPEIRAFLDEFATRRNTEAGYGMVGTPDRTAEEFSPGVAPGGVNLNILKLGDKYLAECTLFRIDGRYTQHLAFVDRDFVSQLFESSCGICHGDAEKAYSWMPHFGRLFRLNLQ